MERASELYRRASHASRRKSWPQDFRQFLDKANLRAPHMGLAFAVFCAATTGVVPLLGIAALLAAEGEVTPVPVTPVVNVPLREQASSSDAERGLWELSRSLESLRQEVRQERRSEPARLQRLEEALAEAPGQQAIRDAARAADLAVQAEQKAWAAAKAARAAAAAAGAPSEAEDLGMDWAAWTAGAEIDHSHTSQGLGRTLWARAGRVLACLAPSWRMSLGASQAPEVVLTWETGPPSRCFTFDGAVGELSIRFWQPLRPSHVVLEQSPNWALANPRASPRHFEVRAWRAGDVSQYEVRLGRFEYQLAQGGSQVFNLTSDGTALRGLVRGLQFRFEDNWGEDNTLVCRLRVFSNHSH